MKLQSFQQTKHVCPKCGGKDIQKFYCNEPKMWNLCGENDVQKEHIHLSCTTCKYEWLMRCKK